MLLTKEDPLKSSQQLLLDLNYCINRSPKDLSIDAFHCEQAHSNTSGSISSEQSPPSSVLSMCTSTGSAPTMLMFGAYPNKVKIKSNFKFYY